ncbi:MAG: hypothetical protein II164_07275 [Firmicutes bacterium]|nr:hypothetical protein [Bacillota bacterium]
MNSSIMMLDIISRMWKDNAAFSYVQALLIGFFFFVCSEALCYIIHILQRGFMIEYGYGRRVMKKKERKKYEKTSIFEKLLLIKLYKNAKNKGLFMLMCFSCNILACIASITSVVGFVGCLITKGSGWSMVLVLSGVWAFFITVVIEFFPSFILPSERERYPWFRRK